jgi:nondiscriminating aspartyl-tRNA synthetase
MNERVLVGDLKKHTGEDVTAAGWVHALRKQGKVVFIILRDRSGTAQLVTDDNTVREQDVRSETVISVTGTVTEDARAEGGVEIQVAALEVLSRPVKNLPILVSDKAEYQKLELETVLNNRVLSLRNPRRNVIFKLQAGITDVFRDFFSSHGYTEVHTPKIIATGTEGGTQLFSVDYFDRLAFLAQSPQFYKQMLVASGYERVFEIGPVYRAEIHNTSRHLNEYISLDYEMGFIENEHDVMDMEEAFIKELFARVNERYAHILKMYGQELPVPDTIPRMPVKEACRILDEHFDKPMKTLDLDPEGEKLLCDWVREKHGTELVFLTEYPRSKRPVYTMPLKSDPELTRSFDLLFRGLEITTGGQRIHSYDMLVEAFTSRGLDFTRFDYYLDTFAYGVPPHGGLAIGLERITQQILGLSNVREAALFPRDRNRIIP